jgi:hypothetical protein
MIIGFTDNLQVITTNNYNTIADFHTLQITTAYAKSFPACSVFTRRFLVTASNSGYSSASGLKTFLNGTELFFLHLSSSEPLSTERVENTVSNNTSIVTCVSVAAGTCLPSCCLETALVYLLTSRSLHSNGSTRYNMFLYTRILFADAI